MDGLLLMFPVQEIARSQDMVLIFSIHHHDQVVTRAVPEDLWISLWTLHYRIVLVELPGAPVIQTIRTALASVIETRPKRDHWGTCRIAAQTGGVMEIDHTTARLNAAIEFFFPERGV